jgi:NAD(P)-dependent dehydrogenase (short-subunit alcohol dehydrogenase family)
VGFCEGATQKREIATTTSTFLVTGATSGIGEAIATQLAERGARILLGARTTERGQEAADRIRNRIPDADLELATGDLSLMREVRSLAYEVMDSTPRLDCLILNAAEARKVGLGPDVVPTFVHDWIRSVEDITAGLSGQRTGHMSLPTERPYTLPPPSGFV